MALSYEQKQVLVRMVTGAVTACAILVIAVYVNPFHYPETSPLHDRLTVALTWGLIPAVSLAVAISRQAHNRFHLCGGNSTKKANSADDNLRIASLQSQLQNTLEQSVFALITYLVWAVITPSTWLSAIPLAAIAFGIGRILFFKNYSRGAVARAFGFTLSYYPSVLMLASTVAFLILRQLN